MNYGFTPPKEIKTNEFIFGASPVPKTVLCSDGQWDQFLPMYEPQAEKFETWGCTVWGTENALEILFKRLYNREPNYSERYIYILAGVRPPGANPHDVAECIRDKGLIDNNLLPMASTFEEFITPDPMLDEYTALGEQWDETYEFLHDWVFTFASGEVNRPELMKEALRYSPLGVSVTAWNEKDGVYIDNFQPNNHWCVIYGWNEKGWKCFDSYDHSKKIISFDHEISFCKRYYLALRPQEEKKNVWLDLIDRLREFFTDVCSVNNKK